VQDAGNGEALQVPRAQRGFAVHEREPEARARKKEARVANLFKPRNGQGGSEEAARQADRLREEEAQE